MGRRAGGDDGLSQVLVLERETPRTATTTAVASWTIRAAVE
jgi:hypothetical protein